MTRWTQADLDAIKSKRQPKAKPSKYRNQPTEIDGIRFDSKREANYYLQLRVLERAGQVRAIQRQLPFLLHARGGDKVGIYYADFVFEEKQSDGWHRVVADAKGFPTPLYQWKKRHMLAQHGIKIREV